MSSTPPSRATPVPERDEHLLAIGKTCSDPSCHLVDFLPFKCQHCALPFCQAHFKVEAHKCKEYDETKYNRIAPDCPLCNTPVAVRPGQDPNARMEEHFTNECTVMTGRAKAKSTPICAKRTCKKVLFSPIRCDKCRASFCPAHRFPSDHSCSSLSSPSTSAKPTGAPPSAAAAAARLTASAKNLNTRATAASTAIKKSFSSPAPASVPIAKAATTPSTSKSSTPNPFSKTDRRARAERESRRKAMQERAKKGLLTEEEKAILAEEEREAALGEGKKDCVIM